jgi:hypothetical protein
LFLRATLYIDIDAHFLRLIMPMRVCAGIRAAASHL